jgi:hypothetical protein
MLGFTVDKDNLRPLQDRLDKIGKAETPKTVKQVRSILGSANYFRSFVPDYARIVKPLEEITRKSDLPFAARWSSAQDAALQQLQDAMRGNLLLTRFKFGSPVIIHSDASDLAAGAVLIQDGKICAYFSKAFSDSQKKYSVTRREALAALWATRRFRHLFPGPTNIYIDHQALLGSTINDTLISRWLMEISESGAILSYISGEQNLADLPSRTLAQGTQLSTGDIISAIKGDTQNPAATRASRRYRLIDDDLYYVTKDGEFPVIPSEERNTALLNLHLSAGHLSPTALHTLIRQTYRWDHMEDDIKSAIQNCLDCQHGHTRVPLLPNDRSTWVGSRSSWEIFDEFSIDFITDLPKTPRGAQNLLVITDAVSGWPEALPTRTKGSIEVLGCLWELISRYGCPRRIRSDRGSEFTANAVQELYATLMIEPRPTSAYNPSANGQAERRNADVIQRLENYIRDDPEDWDLHLPSVLMGIRITPTDRLGVSPYEVVYNRPPRIPIDVRVRSQMGEEPAPLTDEELGKALSQRIGEAKDRWKSVKASLRRYEARQRIANAKFKPDTWVMARNHNKKKNDPRWYGPYLVIEDTGTAVRLKTHTGAQVLYTYRDVRPWSPRPAPDDEDAPASSTGGGIVEDGASTAGDPNIAVVQSGYSADQNPDLAANVAANPM